MQTGTIVRTNPRGFGFIQQGGGLPDLFFHFRDLPTQLTFGDELIGRKVMFESFETDRGFAANNIRVVN